MAIRIAFIGTGLMGLPMAHNLVGKDYHLTVWNRTESKTQSLAELGVTVAETASKASSEADVVITMVRDANVVEELLIGHGIAKSMCVNSTFIDMSSISPVAARQHAKVLAEHQINYLDSPVSGGTRGAEEASLAIMVGGKLEVFERMQLILSEMGKPKHVGGVGAGQVAKLANQIIVSCTIAAVAEALILARAAGEDPAAVREALLGGFADSRVLREHGQRMVDRNFVPGGPAHLTLKDLDNAIKTSDFCALRLPISELVRNCYSDLIESGREQLDHSALYLQIEEASRYMSDPDRPQDEE